MYGLLKEVFFLFNRTMIVNWLFDRKNDSINDFGESSSNFSWDILLGFQTGEINDVFKCCVPKYGSKIDRKSRHENLVELHGK